MLRSLALHLLPGVFMLVVFMLAAPPALSAGLPPLIPVLGSAAIGLAFQLWHLLVEGKKRNGTWSLAGIVLNRLPMPAWQYAALTFGFVMLAFLINGLTAPIGAALLETMPWLPDWFEIRNVSTLAQYSREMLLLTFLLVVLPINGLAAPIVEELYFRGYLLPRLERFGRWTPVLAAALFTLYHFWQPYYWPTVFLSMLPVVYAVWWKRSVKLGIFIHMALNILGSLLTLLQVLGS